MGFAPKRATIDKREIYVKFLFHKCMGVSLAPKTIKIWHFGDKFTHKRKITYVIYSVHACLEGSFLFLIWTLSVD